MGRGAPQHVIDMLKQYYEEQQRTTYKYVVLRKGGWEKRKVLEAEKNSKIRNMSKKNIAGKTKKKDEQVYVYSNDMVRKKIEEAWDPFLSEWKIDIFQKITRMALDFWYGT